MLQMKSCWRKNWLRIKTRRRSINPITASIVSHRKRISVVCWISKIQCFRCYMQWHMCMHLVLPTLQSSLPVWAEKEATRTEIHFPYSLLQRVWLAFGWRGEEGGHQEVNFRSSRAHQWHLLHKKWHSISQRYVPSENRFLTAFPTLLLCTSSRFNSIQMPNDFKWVFLIYFSTLLSSITLDFKLRREFACFFLGDDFSVGLKLFNASWNDVLPRIFKALALSSET